MVLDDTINGQLLLLQQLPVMVKFLLKVLAQATNLILLYSYNRV